MVYSLAGFFIIGYVIILLIFLLFIYTTVFYTSVHDTGIPSLKLKKDSQELQIALEKYADSYGKFPTEEQGLSALVEKPTLPPIPENYEPIRNKKSFILDPWKTPYILKIFPNGDYAIITLSKDKKVGGEGKNSDFNILKEEEYPEYFKRHR